MTSPIIQYVSPSKEEEIRYDFDYLFPYTKVSVLANGKTYTYNINIDETDFDTIITGEGYIVKMVNGVPQMLGLTVEHTIKFSR